MIDLLKWLQQVAARNLAISGLKVQAEVTVKAIKACVCDSTSGVDMVGAWWNFFDEDEE